MSWPLLDPDGCVCDLAVMDDLLPEAELPLHAMIMAGGRGMRLLPLTETVPKPMLPVGGRPIIEHIIGQLRETGIQQIHVSTHFMPEKIIDHFGDGTNFGVHLTYVEEDRPLGTAGALGLLDTPTEPLLVINGDILTRIDYRAFLEYHREHGAMMTMAVRKYDLNVPYGVVNTESVQVTGIVEKPVLTFFVNAGIYLLEPTAYQFITNGEHLDMTDLIQRLLDHQQKVVCFPVLEYWLDIGQPADYQSAQHEVADWRTHV